jgi:hypothetical protein
MIPLPFASYFENMIKKPLVLDDKEKRVESILKSNFNNNNKSFSCIKISNIYYDIYGDKISKITIYRILKKLGYRFRKSSIKTNKLLGNISLRQTFFVLKIIIRIIKLGGEIVFLDESAFYNENNNMKLWRKEEQDIYFDIQESKKINLILVASSSKIIHYKMSYDSTNEKNFKCF